MPERKRNLQRLEEQLREMKLPCMREQYAVVAKLAQKESLDYEEYLALLVEQQWQHRRQLRTERLLRESRLPLEKTMESFDLQRLPRKVLLQVKALQDGSFLAHKENVLFFGTPGSGKTHLLCALGQKLISDGHRVYFNSCALLVQDLLKAKKELNLPRYLKKLAGFEAIILDDIGYLQQDRGEMEMLFTLLSERYERGSIMLTSNLPFSKWEKIFMDPMVTAAAIDRLVHHSVIVEMNLPSYRMATAKQKRNDKDKS